MEKHTPLPWKTDGSCRIIWFDSKIKKTPQHPLFIVAQCATYCGQGGETLPHETAKTNADFIVRACNSHAALLAACKLALEGVKFDKKGKSVCIPTNALTPYSVKAMKSAIEQAERSGE